MRFFFDTLLYLAIVRGIQGKRKIIHSSALKHTRSTSRYNTQQYNCSNCGKYKRVHSYNTSHFLRSQNRPGHQTLRQKTSHNVAIGREKGYYAKLSIAKGQYANKVPVKPEPEKLVAADDRVKMAQTGKYGKQAHRRRLLLLLGVRSGRRPPHSESINQWLPLSGRRRYSLAQS